MTSDINNKKIFDLLQSAKRILLLTDERIDGDTTGSTLAMFHYLKSIGKEVHVFSPKTWATEYHFLPGYESVEWNPALLSELYDLALIFDCADGKYLSAFPDLQRLPLIVFDHHATNPHYGVINQIVVEASSTGEVVWQFFKTNKIAFSKDAATCLLTAICTDTTVFTNPSTNQVCMEAASELGLAGAKMQEIVRAVYMNKSVDLLKVWGTVLERLQELPDGAVVSFLLLKDKSAFSGLDVDTSAIINFLFGMVADARVVAILSEKEDGSIKGNLRTLNGDVAAIAKRFGGGGHVKAAGFSIENAHLEESPNGWRIVRADGGFLPVAEVLRA